MNKYTVGFITGIVLSLIVVLTNVVFPNNAPDNGYAVSLVYLFLFFIFMVAGYAETKQTKKLKSGIMTGAVSSVIAFVLTMLTFIIIDNLYFGIVSQQAEKLWSFSHQQAYTNMKDFINANNVKGLFFGTIMAAVFGAVAGAAGGILSLWNSKKMVKYVQVFYKKHRQLVYLVFGVFIICVIFGVYQVLYLQKAHSTFENYYIFRGCVQLVTKTENYGICKLASGKTIKIVKFDNRWFLEGDLPCGFLCF